MTTLRTRRPPARPLILAAGVSAALVVVSLAATALGARTPTSPTQREGAVTVPAGMAPNPAAPRPYFPADVTQIPASGSLPDLFTFFSAEADPNGNGTVDDAGEWAARTAELSDLMQYYLYGHQQQTPEDGSVFRQVQVPESKTINFGAVFDFTTFTFHLPPGSFNFDFSTFTLTPVLSFVTQVAYDSPPGFQDWDVGDTWNDEDHRTLLITVPATTRMVVDVTDPMQPVTPPRPSGSTASRCRSRVSTPSCPDRTRWCWWSAVSPPSR
jgi:hypothetical protein